jgi:GDP-4-dehydro-6-deoxy-D-mannose reductase
MAAPILVTGASGFAGSHLLEALAREERSEVEAWQWPPGGRPAGVPASRWKDVDLLDRSLVVESISQLRPGVVYHCAGAAHVGQAWSAVESAFAVNLRATHYLLDALRSTHTPAKVVIPGSAMVYRPSNGPLREDDPLVPSNPYGLSKLAQEMLGWHGNGDAVSVFIARAFNHFGPRQSPSFSTASFARQVAEIEAGRRRPEIVVGNLDAKRDLTDVRDTVRAYRLIVQRGRPGRPYNVCSGRAPSMREFVDRLLARARVSVSLRVDPERYRPNDLPLLLGDGRRIAEEIGWNPEIPFDRSVDDLLDYWRNRVNTDTDT